MDLLKTELAKYAKQVRLPRQLTTSPACLVVQDHDSSPMLGRVLQHVICGVQEGVLEPYPKHRTRGVRGTAWPARFSRTAKEVMGKIV